MSSVVIVLLINSTEPLELKDTGLMGMILTQSEITLGFQRDAVYLAGGFPGGSAGKESNCNAGDLGSIPGLGRSPGEGNSIDCIVHGVAESQSDFHFTGDL